MNNSNNTNTTNHVHDNNITVNLIQYSDEYIEFDDRHITRKDLKRIFHRASAQTITSILAYGRLLLEKRENRCIRKPHITNSYCEVYTKDGWVTRADKRVIARFSQDVAGSANDRLYEHPDIGREEIRREVTEIASYEDKSDKNKELQCEMRSLLHSSTRDV